MYPKDELLAKQFVNRLQWALYRLGKEAYNKEDLELYSAGMRDARKAIETAFFAELGKEGYFNDSGTIG